LKLTHLTRVKEKRCNISNGGKTTVDFDFSIGNLFLKENETFHVDATGAFTCRIFYFIKIKNKTSKRIIQPQRIIARCFQQTRAIGI
jgi:hypothetical protein